MCASAPATEPALPFFAKNVLKAAPIIAPIAASLQHLPNVKRRRMSAKTPRSEQIVSESKGNVTPAVQTFLEHQGVKSAPVAKRGKCGSAPATTVLPAPERKDRIALKVSVQRSNYQLKMLDRDSRKNMLCVTADALGGLELAKRFCNWCCELARGGAGKDQLATLKQDVMNNGSATFGSSNFVLTK